MSGDMAIDKKCGCCGLDYLALPAQAKLFLDPEDNRLSGYYWDCTCRSTLFVPLLEESCRVDEATRSASDPK